MIDPVESVINAKSAYELAVVLLAIGIMGSAWVVKKFFEMSKIQDDKELLNLKNIENINKYFVEHINQIHKEYSDRMERLIEAHRTELLTSIQKLTTEVHNLYVVTEKRINMKN